VAVIGRLAVVSFAGGAQRGAGSVLVELSVVEQRYRAVLAVLGGESVTTVAAQVGVSRQTVHAWLFRYRDEGLGGLMDRSHRPESCPHRAPPEVEAVVCEMRRERPRWGPRRLAFELGRRGMAPVPSRATVYRILVRHGLVEVRKRGRRRDQYTRWERDAPMALWQLDIVGGVFLGDGREVKVVTGVDDHSRFCVIAQATLRATGRAVCLAFARALQRYGVPEEVLTDNGKQFTARFGRGGEVLFDRICRDNGIVHRLTQPASPTTTGKIERFHQTLRRDLLADHEPFATVADLQALLDAWVAEDYNTRRPHQSLDMASPAERFRPVPDEERAALPLRLPAALAVAPTPSVEEPEPAAPARVLPLPPSPVTPDVVEFDRVVPPSGNMSVAGQQFWLGPDRAGITVTFWADHDVIHLTAGGARLKTVRSHLSSADLARLAATGGRPAGPPPLPPPEPDGGAVEVDRVVSRAGTVSLGGRVVLAAEILGGRRVTARIDDTALVFFDPETRELLRTRPSPLTYAQAVRMRGARPAGPPPRPSLEPVRVQRRASNTGVIMVASQKVALGRVHAHTVVTVHVAETTLTIEAGADVRTVARTTTQPVRSFKASRPRKAAL
jgi:transposase InsO family protein